MNRHTETAHKQKCDQRDNKAKSKQNTKHQSKTTHEAIKPSNSKRIQCMLCDKKFNKNETFNTHMKKAHNQRIHQQSIKPN